jgi:ABC-type uncharacterized transport system involved in gliding motility auxiliary subunit
MTRTPKQSWMVMQQVQQLFEVESLGNSVDEIAEGIELLILIHPKSLPKATLYAIDQHVLRGGRLLVFVDPFAEQDVASMAGSVAADRASDLPELFAAWGIAYDPLKFVADYDLSLQVSMEQGMRPVRHLGILQLDQQRFDQTHQILSQLDSINLSSVGYFKPTEGANIEFRPLWQSSQRAMIMDADKLSFLNNPADLLKDFQPSGEHYTLAAAISGKAKSAFPEGVPVENTDETKADAEEAADEKAASADADKATKAEPAEPDAEHVKEGDIHVIVVADTDVLSDRMWVQLRQFFGQRIVQPFADNGAFFYNSVDNLTGSQDLISIRNRGRFLRPFTLVEQMRRSAEEDFRQKEQGLQQQLEQTERKLVELQEQRDDSGNMMMLTPEQEAEVARFQQEKLRIRRELREVQHQLNRDIDRLDLWLKLFNILLVPLALTVVVVVAALLKRRRRNRVYRVVQ